MASALKPGLCLPALLLPLLLGACGSLTQISTEEALQMQNSALLAYEEGEDAKAEALFVGLLKIAPNDAETLLRLGNLYARSGRPEHAADAYQRALLLTPGDERLWYNLGVIRQRQAHAAYIQAEQLSKPGDEVNRKSELLIKQLAPLQERKEDTPAPPSDASAR